MVTASNPAHSNTPSPILPPKNSPFASPHIPPSDPLADPGRHASETLLAGPFSFFQGSVILEFLHPHPSRNASVLMRFTYPSSHPLNALGKKHPQAPPLHIHFHQSETVRVVRGRVGVTQGWGRQHRDFLVDAGMDEVVTPAWEPHSLWPNPDAQPGIDEDGVVLVWAGPRAAANPLDHVFFYNLLALFSDAHEAGKRPGLLQAALTQYETETAVVVAPTASWLGPLRWAAPYALEAVLATAARAKGLKPFLEKYTTEQQGIDVVRKVEGGRKSS